MTVVDQDSLVPAPIVDAAAATSAAVDDLGANLRDLIDLAHADGLADLPPLVRARAFHVLAHSATVLLSVRLRCIGIRAEEHVIQSEFERLSLYEEKLKKHLDRSKAPLRPSTRLNPQAAARFIGHSLTDLSPGQRQSIHDLSKAAKWNRDRSSKRRKSQPLEKKSVRDAAKEFLEKAARELLGPDEDGVKGPLRIGDIDGKD